MESKYIDKFLSLVEQRGPNDCWLWKRSKHTGWYGTASCGLKKRKLAHRVAFELANGVELSERQHVCHKCDNPACVNPAHLFVGSHADNMRDRDLKGRQPLGEKNGQARLTAKDVLAIRAIGRSQPQTVIAEKFGITRAAVGDILFGRRWAHVGGPLVSRDTEHANKRGCERHAMAKMTNADAERIRAMCKSLSYREVARREKVDRKTVSHIARGLAWKTRPVGGSLTNNQGG